MQSVCKFLLLSLVAVQCTACQTTGDPTRGGIFWSENKAQDRLQERRSELGAIEADTSRMNRKNGVLEDSAARKRKYLGE